VSCGSIGKDILARLNETASEVEKDEMGIKVRATLRRCIAQSLHRGPGHQVCRFSDARPECGPSLVQHPN
jgi:hypothetical protein